MSESAHGIAVDPINERLYWNNPGTNALRWANLDGSDAETIVTNAGSGDISLDLLNGKIYWNASGSPIRRANLDGSAVETIVSESVHGVAVDAINERLYWNNPGTNALRWANLDGMDAETIVTNAGSGAIALDNAYVPEPGSLVIFAFGSLAAVLRRRKRTGTRDVQVVLAGKG